MAPPVRSAPLRAPILRALLKKEFREVVRDRRTLLLTLVLPAVVYPLLMAAMTEVSAVAMASLRGRPVEVAVQGALDQDVRTALMREARVVLHNVDDAEAEVSAGEAAVGLVQKPARSPGADPTLQLLLDGAKDEGRAGADRLELILARVREARLESRIKGLGVTRAYLEPLPVQRRNTSGKDRMAAYVAAQILPFLLIVLSLVGATGTAVDTTAGERERGTLLTLMSTPVRASEVAASKLITVAAVAMVAGGTNLLALLLSLRGTLGRLAEFSLTITPGLVLGTVAALIPTTVYGAALLLGLAALGKTTKEAQASTAPALFLCLGLAAITVVPGVRANAMLSALPVAGPALLMRDLILGQATWVQALTVAASSAVALWLMVSFAGRVLQSEPLLGSHLGAAAVLADVTGSRTPTGLTAAMVAALLLGLSVYIAPLLQGWDLPLGLMGTLILLGLTPMLLLRALGLPVATLVGTHVRPSGRALASALLFGLSLGAPLMLMESALLQMSGLQDAAEEMGRMAEALTGMHLGVVDAVLLLGVLPGLFEELGFRGALMGVLLRVTTPRRAVVVQAVAFALAHQSLLRFPPTFILGVLMGLLRLRSGSVWPGVVLHGVHNGLVAALAFGVPGLLDPEVVEDALSGPALWAALTLSLLMAAWLLWRTRPTTPSPVVRP